jgi:hypothetical protein
MCTPVLRRAVWAAVLGAMTLLAAGCEQKKTPKVDAAAERAAALARAKESAYGAQVKGLESARGLEADVNRKAQDSVDRIEKEAR